MDGLIALALAKKYTDSVGQNIISAGFRVQVEQDRSILETTGEEKVLYLLPKASSNLSNDDGYDEFVYANNKWEWVGKTDVDLDYELLSNKPQINGVTLSGNKRSNDLGLQIKTNFDSQEFEIINRGNSYIEVGIGTIPSSKISGIRYYFETSELVYDPNPSYGHTDIYDFKYCFVSDPSTHPEFKRTGCWYAQGVNCRNIPSELTNLITNNTKLYIFHYYINLSYNTDINSNYCLRQIFIRDDQNQYKIRQFAQLCSISKHYYDIDFNPPWTEIGGGSQIVSGVVNANGTITFTDSDGNVFNTSGSNIVTSGNEQISVGYDNGGFYFLFDDGQESE